MPYSDFILSGSSSPPLKSSIWNHNIFPWVGLERLPQQLLCSLAVTSGVPTPSFTVPAGTNSQGINHCLAGARWLFPSPAQTSGSAKSSGEIPCWACLAHHQPGTSGFYWAAMQDFSCLSLFLYCKIAHFVLMLQFLWVRFMSPKFCTVLPATLLPLHTTCAQWQGTCRGSTALCFCFSSTCSNPSSYSAHCENFSGKPAA